MTRTRGAAVLFVGALAGACAASGSDPLQEPGADAAEDAASTEGGGPSPDAVVLDDGDHGPSTVDAAGDAPIVGKSCVGLPDGTPCGPAPDVCHDASACSNGVCAPAQAKADGFVCAPAPDACHQDGTCSKGVCGAVTTRADGFQWKSGDNFARCCGGQAVHTTDDANCGVCGIHCNTGNGESCQAAGNTYLCRGCVASAACWSRCCSSSFSPTSCAASDCAGACSAKYCPPGTHCVVGSPSSSDYCAY
jgi:hypothetical protein